MQLYQWLNGHYKIVKIVLQVLYWLCSIIVLGLMYRADMPILDGKFNYIFNEYLPWVLVSYPFKWAIFYSYFYFFIPKWLNRKTLLFIIVTIAILVIYPPLKFSLDEAFGLHSIGTVNVTIDEETGQYEDQITLSTEMSRRVITVVLNVLAAFFYRFTIDWFRNIRIRNQMQQQQLKSELAMLRNQINPHFLFNTLNNIDAMVYKVAPEGSLAINKLATIMRYMLYESNVAFVPLEKEIEYIENYFELQKLRLKNKEVVNLEIIGEVEEIHLAPLLFIPFVENAFKHGTFGQKGPAIFCKLEVKESEVNFYIENSHEPKLVESKDETRGIGLENVKRRLALIYPNKYTLEITQGPPLFKVQLTLQTHEN